MSDSGPRVAIVAVRKNAARNLRGFTAVYCNSTAEGSACASDVIVFDLTDGLVPDLCWQLPASVPVIAVLANNATPDEVTTAKKRFGQIAIGWSEPSELVRRAGVRANNASTVEVEGTLLHEAVSTGLLGRSPAFRAAIAKIPLLGRSRAPVLIIGETGTGKELCARALHFASARRDGPFLAVDCAAIPDHLFENEMFGHSRGAYTDASASQKGIVGLAEHGTLFLDEVDSLSLPAQGKLLRFLEERKYRPLGSERFFDADLRVLSATNSRLEDLVKARLFRRDLYYRLNVLAINLPSLRQRREDIPLLALHFIAEAAREIGLEPPPAISAEALRDLAEHEWLGNVRELQNVMRRAVVLSDGRNVDLSGMECAAKPPDTAACSIFKEARGHAMDAFERDFVQQLLTRHEGNITHAAREAGKERRAFGRLVKKHGLSH